MATIKEMIREHNEVARTLGVAELAHWKQAGEKLRERIDAMLSAQAQAGTDPLDLPVDTEAVQVLGDAEAAPTTPSIVEGATELRIEPEDAPEPSAGPWTIGKAVRALLLDPAGLDYPTIVERVKGEFPQAHTTTRSIASVAAAMRRDGMVFPMRRKPRKSA